MPMAVPFTSVSSTHGVPVSKTIQKHCKGEIATRGYPNSYFKIEKEEKAREGGRWVEEYATELSLPLSLSHLSAPEPLSTTEQDKNYDSG